ncbi:MULTISPECIES: hypothetical protein [unclassified Microbacterium]|uniref:hypothetical protein n=1 Tax=unclassified Microbacterium TaxID=2609290 RepID=UPI000DE4412F|nr:MULTISPECIES: hypothetical protein [unclassified Microbacterium]NYF28391.1 fucose 4-O-acetylase-like acetyltransferase [Microbacterium sp. JAI119]RBO72085.1 hypothetical protein DSP71_12725 [Microbacterium sp. H6]
MSPRPSPRTTEQPMAFSRREFWRGAVATWITFNALFLLVTTVVLAIMSRSLQTVFSILILVAWFQLLFVVATSALATVIGSGAAFVLGRLLRTTAGMRQHLIAFAGLGLVVGGVVIAVVGTWPANMTGEFGSLLTNITEPYIALPLLGMSAVSVAHGWYWTASRALSEDPAPQSPVAEAQLAG